MKGDVDMSVMVGDEFVAISISDAEIAVILNAEK